MTITDILEEYDNRNFDNVGGERSFLWFFESLESWNNLSDYEKLDKRKKDLRDFETFFIRDEQSEKIFNYEKLVCSVHNTIHNILKKDQKQPAWDNEYFFRVKSMLYCEYKFLNQFDKIKKIGHVPFFIFEPLIKEIETFQEYKEFELNGLFERYRKMYELFLDKPYERFK